MCSADLALITSRDQLQLAQCMCCFYMNVQMTSCSMPTGMEEAPKMALDIHCLWRGGGVALTQKIN